MGSRGSSTQTTNTTPWPGQQPYLSDIFQQAQGQYQAGGPQYYPLQTVAPFSPQTEMGLDLSTQRALSGDPSQQAFQQYLTGTLGGGNIDPSQIAAGGFGAMQNLGPAAGYLQQAGQPINFGTAGQMAGVGGDIGLGQAAQFFDQPSALPSALPGAAGQLGATAGGQYLGSNPYLDQLYDTAAGRVTESFQEDVLPGIAAQFGAAGRTGSGAQALTTGRAAGDVAQELSGLAADIYAPAYEAERGRQLQAAGQLGQLGLGADQLGLGQARAAADLYGQGLQSDIARRQLAGDIYTGGLGRQLQAGQALGQLGMGGLEALGGLYSDIGQQQFRAGSLTPTLQQMQYADIDRLMGVGGTIEDQAQRLIDADRARWEYGQQLPQNMLQNYANIIYGLPGSYGQTASTTPGGSRLTGAAGGALSGAALGPWGALGGAVLGGLL